MRRTTGEDGYCAAALACAGDDGIAFTDLVCAPTASRFYDGRVDHMQLCVIAEGQFGVVHGRDERLWLGPGAGLQLLDCQRTAQTYSEISYRSEERRVGKECDSTCRYWWWPYPTKKKKR